MPRKKHETQHARADAASLTPPPTGATAVAPWLPFLLYALPVALIGLFSIHTLGSIYQDIGRHLALGKIISETGHIPATNLFSYTNPDYPFINHHWLFEVGLYHASELIGLPGLIVAKALILAGAFALAFGATWKKRIAGPAALVAVAAFLLMMDRTDVRPEVLTYLFMGWFLFVLYRRQHWMWTLPIVSLVWVNVHIFFFVGPMLWTAWLGGRIAEVKTWRPLLERKHLLVTAGIVLATLCNPHFVSGALYPLRVMSSYGYLVAENQPPGLLWSIGDHHPVIVMVYVCIAIVAVSFALNRRNIRRNSFALITCVLTAGLSLAMSRCFALFALALLPAVVRNLDEAEWHFPAMNGWVAAAMVGLLFSVFSGSLYRFGVPGRTFGLNVPPGFDRAMYYFRTAGFKGPIFNNFDIGSYLIWKLPEERVFVDGRPEAYPPDFFERVYIPMQEDSTVWAGESERYHINAIIWNTRDVSTSAETFVNRIMADTAHWTPMFLGDRILILMKKTEENLPLMLAHPPVNLDKR